jgi:hypothetical protein
MHSTLSLVGSHKASALEVARQDAVLALARAVELGLPDGACFAQRERAMLEVANEICRQLMAADLQRIAQSHSDEVVVGGERYRRHERGVVAYHTLCGDVEVERCSYRLARVRNGPTIVPLEVEAGLVEGATPALAYSVADGIAEMPSRRYEEVLRAAHRVIPSRSTVERLAKNIGNEVKRDIIALETIVRADEQLPAGAHAISVGLDRTTVPMAEERPPSQPPSSGRKRRTKPRVRRAPPPVDVCYRMAYVGTVAVVDGNGEALVTRKCAATAEEGPTELVQRVMAEVRALRDQRPLPVVVVQDGAPELWGLMWEALRMAGIGKHESTFVLDRYHVTERIGTVLAEVVRDEAKRRSLFATWRARLETSDRAVSDFCRWFSSLERAKPRLFSRLLGHYTYLASYSRLGYTRYRTLRLRGFPTASGVTEGACKSLIAARCKRSGQRWQQDGLTAILTLRAVAQSERMPAVWPLFMRRYNREVDCLA